MATVPGGLARGGCRRGHMGAPDVGLSAFAVPPRRVDAGPAADGPQDRPPPPRLEARRGYPGDLVRLPCPKMASASAVAVRQCGHRPPGPGTPLAPPGPQPDRLLVRLPRDPSFADRARYPPRQ